MRRFHQATGVVLGYDETAFPQEAVQRARLAWQAVLPARTMRFLRADPQAPASVLLSFGSFDDSARLLQVLDLVRSEAARPARRSLEELFAVCRKASPEFQFRYDLGATMVRGRTTPAHAREVDAAVCGLWDLAAALDRAGLPPRTTVVVACFRGWWEPDRAHAYHPSTGRAEVYRYRSGRWEQGLTAQAT